MTTQPPTNDSEIDYSTLGTLKQLGLAGALHRETKMSIPSLAAELDISIKTMRKRLEDLDQAGLISQRSGSAHPQILITDQGRSALRNEYEELQSLCERKNEIELEGVVADGIGEGSYFVSLDGYQEQFVEKIGYEPFPGTLNIELEPESIQLNSRLERADSILIESWTNEKNQTFGPVYCHPGILRTEGSEYEPVHIIKPEHSRYDNDIAEIIAPDKLRDALELETGHQVTISVDRN
jgi:riboflavin kinase